VPVRVRKGRRKIKNKYLTSYIKSFIKSELYFIKSVEDLSSLYKTITESSLNLEEILDLISNLKQKYTKAA